MKVAGEVKNSLNFLKVDYAKWISILMAFITTIGAVVFFKALSYLGQVELFVENISITLHLLLVGIAITVFAFFLSIYLVIFILNVKFSTVSTVCTFLFLLLFNLGLTLLCEVKPSSQMLELSLLFYLISLAIIFMFRTYGKITKTKDELNGLLMIAFLCVFFPMYIVVFIPSSSLFLNVLHVVGYVQNSTSSSFYFLNKRFIQDYDFDEHLLFSKDDSYEKSGMGILRERFVPSNEFMLNEKMYTVEGENILFGYFLWNVGDRRLFCPQTVNASEKSIDKKIKENCILIDRKHLQPVPYWPLESTATPQES